MTLTADSPTTADFTLEVAGVQESVSVGAAIGYSVPAVSSATKTTTPLRDVPQAVSVVTSALIADQRMASMADVTRYMPGVGFAQGEGNRDTPILRGNSTTSDFFVDGVRDDVQYFRDVYNVDRVEALKGPNAMIFGRGGVGGVINRVTRQADWGQAREASLQFGSWNNKRFTADVGRGLNETVAVRATGLYENSDSYRDGFNVERYGFNPTVAFRLGPNTTLRGSYEYFHDERIADRGISSFNGRPVETDPGTFFGDPTQSPTDATVNLVSGLLEHRFNSRVTLRNRLSYGDYDKFYQNVFPGAVNAAGTTVAISAYNNATTRQNLFNQTDLIVSAQTGRFGHTLLLGTEFGRQETSNFRETGFFSSLGANVTTFNAPLASPTISLPVDVSPERHGCRQPGRDDDRVGLRAGSGGAFGARRSRRRPALRQLQCGRHEQSDRDGLQQRRRPGVAAPRVDLQADSAAVALRQLQPDLPAARRRTALVVVADESGARSGGVPELRSRREVGRGAVVLVHGRAVPPGPRQRHRARSERSDGLDSGRRAAHERAGARRQWLRHARLERGRRLRLSGRRDHAIDLGQRAGRRVLAQLPKHSISLWNKYDFTPRLAAALGVIYRGDVFTSTDNLVVLPNWTRVDAALYYNLTSMLRAQVNIENLFDENYYPNAHSNTNITPGSPRAVRFALTTRF